MGLPGVWNIGEEQIGLSMQVTETTCVSGEFYACFHADTLDRWIKKHAGPSRTTYSSPRYPVRGTFLPRQAGHFHSAVYRFL